MAEEINEMLERFKQDIARDADALSEQRDKADEDMRFVNVDGGQWEEFLEDEYGGRTKLELDIISDHKNRFVGEWNQNRIDVEFKPDDSNTSDDDAELLNGIYRADYRDNSGKIAVDNAVDEVATCGFGAYGMSTRFVDDENPENDDQQVVWRPIHSAYNTIFFDQSGRREDKQDARWVTELTPYTKDSFKDAFGELDATSAYTPSDRSHLSYSQSANDIYVATRYEIIKKRESVFVYNNLATREVEAYSKDDHELVKDELKASDVHKFVRERKVLKRKVMMSRFAGKEFIEEPRQIAGDILPIVPIYGYRAYIDGREHYYGLIRKKKDGQRLWNMQVSQLAENSASSGQDVPIFLREQMEAPDVSSLWADKNNKPYLIVDPVVNEAGDIVAAGPAGYNKPGQLDASTATLMNIIPEYIRSVTGGAPQDTLDPSASGKAINAMLKRENLNTQTIADNIANSVSLGGNLYQSIAKDIYNTKRIVRTLGKDGTEGSDTLLKTVMDEETGQLVQANTLRGKKFRAYADVGPQYDSMREQTVEDLKGMIEVLISTGKEEYVDATMSVMLENITGVGLGPLKDLNRKNMIFQGLIKPENEEEEKMLAEAKQPKTDPQADLTKAAAKQQIAEANNLEASAIDKKASADKKAAETENIRSDTKIEQLMAMVRMKESDLSKQELTDEQLFGMSDEELIQIATQQ